MCSSHIRIANQKSNCAEPVTIGVLQENVFLEISQNSQENTCARVFLLRETLGQVFSFEFCEISKNTVFTEHVWTTASNCDEMELANKKRVHLLYCNFYFDRRIFSTFVFHLSVY